MQLQYRSYNLSKSTAAEYFGASSEHQTLDRRCQVILREQAVVVTDNLNDPDQSKSQSISQSIDAAVACEIVVKQDQLLLTP